MPAFSQFDLTKNCTALLLVLDSGEIAFDRLVIECTGLADPAPRRFSFTRPKQATATWA